MLSGLTLTQEEPIREMTEYLNSLKLKGTFRHLVPHFGQAYNILVYLQDGSERKFRHMGNIFFKEEGFPTKEIEYDQATHIDRVIGLALMADKAGTQKITGTVKRVMSTQSGTSKSCDLETENGSNYTIRLEEAMLFDTTGQGWMILLI
ncbi:MAG: hypothetical protein GX434_13415 [Peptococcaceae bacterium]|nr:hypothetical protein [Peptococcaceae bacterium]